MINISKTNNENIKTMSDIFDAELHSKYLLFFLISSDNNGLTGPVPSEIGLLASLEELWLGEFSYKCWAMHALNCHGYIVVFILNGFLKP